MGGSPDGTNGSNVIGYITIASAGDATDFGDLTTATFAAGATSNSIRAVIGGGKSPNGSTLVNVMEYVTITSTGNATDFGDMTGTTRSDLSAAADAHGGLQN